MNKPIHKPVSVFQTEEDIINKKFSKYGDFTNYIRFCIRNPKSYIFEKPAKTTHIKRMLSLTQEDLELINSKVEKHKFSEYVRNCVNNQELMEEFKNVGN